MHKTVRYYITEADDQPVVRTVPVAIYRAPAARSAEASTVQNADPQPKRPGDQWRSSRQKIAAAIRRPLPR